MRHREITSANVVLANCKAELIILYAQVNEKISTIPHSTLSAHFSQPYDDPRQRWDQTNDRYSGTIAQDRNVKSSTIEGGNSTGDTSIGGSGLHLAITAHQTDTERFNDNSCNRGGGGGGVSVSCGGQSPPTPTVGKTLLNTSPNLLPITTASDTFNNLKNLVKIDKGSSPTNVNTNSGGSSYRSKGNVGGYKNNGNLTHTIGVSHSVSTSADERGLISNGNGSSGSVIGTGGRAGAGSSSGYISSTYNRNSAKIRQYDSDVSPRPRRTYQGDSSSSRYYNKNSDTLGQGPKSAGTGGNGTLGGAGIGRAIIGNDGNSGRGSYNADGSNNRRYNNQSSSDGGYNSTSRNINSTGGGGNSYRHQHQHQQGNRYENSNGQQRSYGNSTNTTYNSNYSNKQGYGSRTGYNDGNVSARSNHREDYGSNNYREYDDTPRSRYNTGNNSSSNSLERGNNGRYKPSEQGNGNSHIPSALRQGGISIEDRYDRASSSTEGGRAYNNRTPPIRGGNVSGTVSVPGAHSSTPTSINSASSSSRGISPNSAGVTAGAQHSSPSPTPPPPSAGRWVPPSLRPQHGLSQTEKNDAVFRKVSYYIIFVCLGLFHLQKFICLYLGSRYP